MLFDKIPELEDLKPIEDSNFNLEEAAKSDEIPDSAIGIYNFEDIEF